MKKEGQESVERTEGHPGSVLRSLTLKVGKSDVSHVPPLQATSCLGNGDNVRDQKSFFITIALMGNLRIPCQKLPLLHVQIYASRTFVISVFSS